MWVGPGFRPLCSDCPGSRGPVTPGRGIAGESDEHVVSLPRVAGGMAMKAFIVFTEAEPVLVMTSRAAASNGRLEDGLTAIGFRNFIAHEVPVDGLKERYGIPFEVIESEVREGRDLRVLDSKGSHVFENIRFADLGTCIRHDSRSDH